jgi:peptidoglycan/LPS O-acetylase OafA/YrhL
MDMKTESRGELHILHYRADIDGLRAIAVLSVILFHFSRSTLPGGYLGVDMFFVVSGFLITSIIWREAQNGQFSIVRFYDRRIRRIIPALLVVLLFATPLAAVTLLPRDLIGYGKSLLATVLFGANFYFWRETAGYFQVAADQQPLLHTWSLGVEEQFYILFPLMLALLARRWPAGTLPVMGALTLSSLAFNMLAIDVGVGHAAFFLLPTRAWELGVGSILALLPLWVSPRGVTASLIAVLGLLLVVIGIVHPLEGFEPVPVSVAVVGGTALLILSGSQDRWAVNRALRLRPVVYIGLISYSLYLWHWPILVFGQYYLVHSYSAAEVVAAVMVLTTCGSLSWRFIELPFRSKMMPFQTSRYVAAAGVAALATAAVVLIWSDGLPHRLNKDAARINEAVGTNYHCSLSDTLSLGLTRACRMNLPSGNPEDADVVMLGNSHAMMYAPLWASILAERRQTGLLIPVPGCLPTIQVNASLECNRIAQRVLAAVVALGRVRTVILGLTWYDDSLLDANRGWIDNSDMRALVSALDDLIDQLQRAGKQVVLIGPIAIPGWDVPSVISRRLAFGRMTDQPTFQPASDFAKRFGPVIRHFEARGDIGFARPDLVQCSKERCSYLLDGRSLFADEHHLAAAELWRFRAVFEASLLPVDIPSPREKQ